MFRGVLSISPPSPPLVFPVYNLTRSPLTAALYYLNAWNRLESMEWNPQSKRVLAGFPNMGQTERSQRKRCNVAGENSRFSSLLAAWDVSRRGTSATHRQKFHTQCLHTGINPVVMGFQMHICSGLRFPWSILVDCKTFGFFLKISKETGKAWPISLSVFSLIGRPSVWLLVRICIRNNKDCLVV